MLLTALVFLPLLGAAVILLLRDGGARWARVTAAAVAVTDFALALTVFARYDSGGVRFQMADRLDWIPVINAQYHLAVDGLSAPLVLLTGLLGLCAVFCSWNVTHRPREYFAWLLVLQTAVMGVFTAQDLLLFFIFWELELAPMYFLISIWGSGRKDYSAMKFLLFTFGGSAFMLVGLLAVYFSTGLLDMTAMAHLDTKDLLLPAQVVFALFFIAFAVKLPVWPVHTWLPDAHTDAPTAVSVMLAGVLLKMGGYGMIRINAGMFPEVTAGAAPWLAALAVVSILYGAMVTFRQSDLKRLVANSSISHMGFVLLGVSTVGAAAQGATPVGLTGAALQMFSHGVITGLLFVMVGVVYDRAHTRHIPDLGGLAGRMPLAATVFLIAGVASLGLPGTSGFAAEILVFLGAFPVHGVATALATVGVLLAAGYVLWTLQRALFGPARERWAQLTDMGAVEAVAPALLVAAILIVGIYPAIVTDVLQAGVVDLAVGAAP